MKPTGIEIWAENERSVDLFEKLSTQWRVGMAGATGLDYATLPFLLRAFGIIRADWRDILDDIRILERAALEEMHRD